MCNRARYAGEPDAQFHESEYPNQKFIYYHSLIVTQR